MTKPQSYDRIHRMIKKIRNVKKRNKQQKNIYSKNNNQLLRFHVIMSIKHFDSIVL